MAESETQMTVTVLTHDPCKVHSAIKKVIN